MVEDFGETGCGQAFMPVSVALGDGWMNAPVDMTRMAASVYIRCRRHDRGPLAGFSLLASGIRVIHMRLYKCQVLWKMEAIKDCTLFDETNKN